MVKALGGGGSYPCGKTSDRTASPEDTGWEVEIHLGGNVKGGGGVLDDREIHQAAAEHSCIVHCYAINIRPV